MGARPQSNVIAKAPVVEVVLALFSLFAKCRDFVLMKPRVSEDGFARLLDRFQCALVGERRWCRPKVRIALDGQLVPGDMARASANSLGQVGRPRLRVLSG